MSEITKDYLDRALKGLTTKQDLADSEKRVIKRIDEVQEELARMVSAGFEDVMERLDVKEAVQVLKKQMAEIRSALHLTT